MRNRARFVTLGARGRARASGRREGAALSLSLLIAASTAHSEQPAAASHDAGIGAGVAIYRQVEATERTGAEAFAVLDLRLSASLYLRLEPAVGYYALWGEEQAVWEPQPGWEIGGNEFNKKRGSEVSLELAALLGYGVGTTFTARAGVLIAVSRGSVEFDRCGTHAFTRMSAVALVEPALRLGATWEVALRAELGVRPFQECGVFGDLGDRGPYQSDTWSARTPALFTSDTAGLSFGSSLRFAYLW